MLDYMDEIEARMLPMLDDGEVERVLVRAPAAGAILKISMAVSSSSTSPIGMSGVAPGPSCRRSVSC
ncbi:hypothetical protein [Vreelandella azerica]|uniref:hypothetical protein n=1 Tax=Vreelandella azerica TaxID=2732867 RepID=UPI001F3EE910|nr:hypothetical protein [Halomonas azerica]